VHTPCRAFSRWKDARCCGPCFWAEPWQLRLLQILAAHRYRPPVTRSYSFPIPNSGTIPSNLPIFSKRGERLPTKRAHGRIRAGRGGKYARQGSNPGFAKIPSRFPGSMQPSPGCPSHHGPQQLCKRNPIDYISPILTTKFYPGISCQHDFFK